MKKSLIVLAAMFCASTVFAGNKPASHNTESNSSGAIGQNLPGSDSCGLGWQVTDKKSLIATTTRATTNYVVPATFGMTTGTMGCDQHSFAKKDAEGVKFVAGNYEPLLVDMSKGQGEYLSALADTMGCSDKAQFGNSVKSNYGKIVNTSKDAVEFYMNVKSSAGNSCQVI